MFKTLTEFVEREEYMNDFKTLVLYDIYQLSLQEGLRYDYAPFRPVYNHEEAFMTKNTNKLHKKLIGDRNFDKFKAGISERQKIPFDQEVSLETIFKYLKTSKYRFEDYFDDWRIIYPFDEKQSERYRPFMDALAKEVSADPDIPDFRQAGSVFIGSLRYMLKDNGLSERTEIWNTLVYDILGLSSYRFEKAVVYGESIGINHVLRVSYHFQVHPYQLLGLRYTRYREQKTKLSELYAETTLISAYMTEEDKVKYAGYEVM